MAASLETDPQLGVIRIVVVVPAAQGAEQLAGPAPMAVETTAGLARLGDPVELLRAESPAEVATLVADPSIDLVLLDRLDIADSVLMLDAMPQGGPPSVIVCGDSEDEALEAFRAGAADCVQFGSDYERVLPVVLLEQVRRWRARDRVRTLEVRPIPAGGRYSPPAQGCR